MAKDNRTPQTPARPARPPSGADAPDDLLDEGDDEREGAAPERRAPASEPPAPAIETLLEAAKKKLGLPPDASSMDILKAIAGSTSVRPAGPPRAACSLVLVVDDKRVVLAEGDLIPEGVDLADLERRHPHAVARS